MDIERIEQLCREFHIDEETAKRAIKEAGYEMSRQNFIDSEIRNETLSDGGWETDV